LPNPKLFIKHLRKIERSNLQLMQGIKDDEEMLAKTRKRSKMKLDEKRKEMDKVDGQLQKIANACTSKNERRKVLNEGNELISASMNSNLVSEGSFSRLRQLISSIYRKLADSHTKLSTVAELSRIEHQLISLIEHRKLKFQRASANEQKQIKEVEKQL